MTDTAERIELAKLLFQQHDYLGAWDAIDDGASRDYYLGFADKILAAGYRKSDAPSALERTELVNALATEIRPALDGTFTVSGDLCDTVVERCAAAVERYIRKPDARAPRPVLASAMPSPEELLDVLVDVSQLFDGWHGDGTAWTTWDEDVRKRLAALNLRLDALRGAVHINTRDEHGVSQPISSDLAKAVHQAAMVIRESEARSVPATAPEDSTAIGQHRERLASLHRVLNERYPRFAQHLPFDQRDAIVRLVLNSHPVRSDAEEEADHRDALRYRLLRAADKYEIELFEGGESEFESFLKQGTTLDKTLDAAWIAHISSSPPSPAPQE